MSGHADKHIKPDRLIHLDHKKVVNNTCAGEQVVSEWAVLSTLHSTCIQSVICTGSEKQINKTRKCKNTHTKLHEVMNWV